MVGEVRDLETAQLVVHAALTGHLVLSTLHTNDALGAIPRLMDMGVEPFLLSAILRLVGAQRLVKRLCQQCKKPVPIPETIRTLLATELKGVSEGDTPEENQRTLKQLYQAAGCKECGGKGTLGRLAIVEVMPVGERLREAIVRRVTHDEIRKLVAEEGFLTMRQDGMLKALAGQVALEEVLEATSED
jgi:type II secretory ATPase GspE/PulE/Tfp pilus assembly ATPase PilB-like protein